SQNLHPNNSPDLFKSDTGDDRLPQNPVGGGVGKYDKVELTSFLDLLPVYASHLPLPTRTQDSVTLSRPGLRGGPFTHLESTQLSGRTPAYVTGMRIFPERFPFRSFERSKVDVIHRLAGRSGELGGKIPGKCA
uniref:hypothetical protein n=1 Tax=Thiolapillus sp. TaxID=2017437 RepID=UPI003AF9AF1B